MKLKILIIVLDNLKYNFNFMANIKGYKSAKNYIIELNILSPNNNLFREVIDKQYAKYRCDKAFVVRIYNKFTKIEEIDTIASDYDDNFIYKKGQYMFINNYNQDINTVCTNGIHFYLSEEAAYFNNFYDYMGDYIGIYKEWNDNGQLILRCNIKNGVYDGLCEKWLDNGQMNIKCHYKNGFINELYREWYNNGRMKVRCNFKNVSLNGLCETWDFNGNPLANCNYVNGKKIE